MYYKRPLIQMLTILLLGGFIALTAVHPGHSAGVKKNATKSASAKNSVSSRHYHVTGIRPKTASIKAVSPWNVNLLAGKRVLWLGDDITQNGSYVTDVEYTLDRHLPKLSFDFISIGLARETASGLSEASSPYPRPTVNERLQRALDKARPQVVVACYGMNDGIYHPQSPERMKAFQDGIGKLITAVKAAGAKLILLTPPPFDPQSFMTTLPADAPDFSSSAPYVGYDDVLADYARWEMTLSDPDVFVVDLHTPLSSYLAQQRATKPAFIYSADGINPNAAAHLLMSRVFLQALGYPAFTISLDAQLKTFGADAVYNLVSIRRTGRSAGWLPYVGYTRGTTIRASSVTQTETRAADLQAQIDKLRTPLRLACVGDSITRGAGTTDPTLYSYPAVLHSLLGDAYTIVNDGCNGTTITKKGDFPYWDQSTFTAALNFKPDIVVIAFGTNDSKSPNQTFPSAPNNWANKADFVPDYESMIALFRQANPGVKVFVCAPPPAYSGMWGINDTVIRQEVIPLVRKVAADTGAKVIDFYTPLTGKATMYRDTIHPNNDGEAIMAAVVYHALTGKYVTAAGQ